MNSAKIGAAVAGFVDGEANGYSMTIKCIIGIQEAAVKPEIWKAVFVLAALWSLVNVAQCANIVTNGDFEAGTTVDLPEPIVVRPQAEE